MKILVFNAGSSSLKFQLFDQPDDAQNALVHLTPAQAAQYEPEFTQLAHGVVERVGTPEASISYESAGQTINEPILADTILQALDTALRTIENDESCGLCSLKDIDAVGHRVAHGGTSFGCSVPVDDSVVETIATYGELAPLHNPSAKDVIERCRELLPHTLQVAAFDTAFHQTMPARNYVYPIPYKYYEDNGIRRFGFHGISHKYVSRRAAQFLGKSPRDLKMITCHLGAGASLCAIDHGISMDTTMGYTPLDGIMMGTRSGSVDPAIITAIQEQEGMDAAEIDAMLNRESGLLGVSGVSNDLRELKETIRFGNERAELAYDIFLTSIRRMIGAYSFELAGVDAIVCTAGVGENDAYARRLIFRGLEPFGIQIDQERNLVSGKVDRRISTDSSSVDVLVIPTDEEAEIARDVALIAAGVDISDPWV